jgi:hypothetical protein
VGNSGCSSVSSTTPEIYVELDDPSRAGCGPNGEYYTILDAGVTIGSGSTFRIQRNGTCWDVFKNYNAPLGCYASPETSGAADVEGEIYDNVGSANVLPTTTFGSGNPNTNQALRIHGAAGYQAWTNSLTKDGTWLLQTVHRATIHANYNFTSGTP